MELTRSVAGKNAMKQTKCSSAKRNNVEICEGKFCF